MVERIPRCRSLQMDSKLLSFGEMHKYAGLRSKEDNGGGLKRYAAGNFWGLFKEAAWYIL